MAEHHATLEEQLAHAEHSHDGPHVNYMLIFYALCVLTVLSVIADVAGKEKAPIIVGCIVLTIATFKAMFVMLYFMHLKFEGRWKFILLGPTIILAFAIVAALIPDIGVHYYDVQVPQTLQQSGTSHEHAVEKEHIAPLPLPGK